MCKRTQIQQAPTSFPMHCSSSWQHVTEPNFYQNIMQVIIFPLCLSLAVIKLQIQGDLSMSLPPSPKQNYYVLLRKVFKHWPQFGMTNAMP